MRQCRLLIEKTPSRLLLSLSRTYEPLVQNFFTQQLVGTTGNSPMPFFYSYKNFLHNLDVSKLQAKFYTRSITYWHRFYTFSCTGTLIYQSWLTGAVFHACTMLCLQCTLTKADNTHPFWLVKTQPYSTW